MSKITIDKARCKGCYLCVVNCPSGLIRLDRRLNIKGIKAVEFSGGKCTGCTMCALICPECVIRVYR